jgi:hypothetical protein
MTTRDQKSYLLPNPPSHILSNGHFVFLPEPTKQEKALFFQQSIVVHNIVSAQKLGGTPVGDDEEQVDAEEGEVQKSSSSQSEVKIHPLAIAAARIESLGISQLSKSINLGNLIGTEYFDIANIVSPEGILPAAISAKNKSASDNSEAKKKASVGRDRDDTYGKSNFTAQQLLDQRFRAIFLLKRKYSQLVDAAEFLGLHKRRLEGSLDRQRLIDRRYLQLRKQWRLAAPEHGTRVLGPVRSNEVIAVDVETYDRDRLGGKNQLPNEARRRLARLVPRYVTIELEPQSENVKELESSTNLSIENCDSLKQPEVQPMDLDVKEKVPKVSLLSDNDVDQNKPSVAQCNGKSDTASKSQLVTALSQKLKFITKAEPYAVADPTLGKLDLEFNPDKVPIWTLQLSLMKNSTGFSVSSTLSPVVSLHTDDEVTSSEKHKEESGKVKMEEPVNAAFAEPRSAQNDEKVIQSLQHSLFCASIFDAIRNEIRTANASGSSSGSGGSGRATVWLSSETEEMFFPPTLLMASSPGYQPCKEGKLGFCVSYCQEGEVAVQLDPEYVLTIKLIEVGTATETSKMQDKLRNKNNGGMVQRDNIDFKNANDSGSQTPEQLYTLCRALLLHVQFLYHDFRSKTPYINKASSLSSSRLSATHVCARILEKCVAFGSKVLFEKKVMSVLNVRSSIALLLSLLVV